MKNNTLRNSTLKTALQNSATLRKLILTAFVASTLLFQGCVHKVVTVPAKIAYKTTKGVVKGTVAVGKAIIPGDGDDDKKDDED